MFDLKDTAVLMYKALALSQQAHACLEWRPMEKRVRTKHGPGVHGPLLCTGSMDHFRGPGPWTPCHGHFLLNNEK